MPDRELLPGELLLQHIEYIARDDRRQELYERLGREVIGVVETILEILEA